MSMAYPIDGLKDNYYALYLAIRRRMSVTQACIAMDISVDQKEKATIRGVNNGRDHTN